MSKIEIENQLKHDKNLIIELQHNYKDISELHLPHKRYWSVLKENKREKNMTEYEVYLFYLNRILENIKGLEKRIKENELKLKNFI